jgi:hypothetical protein
MANATESATLEQPLRRVPSIKTDSKKATARFTDSTSVIPIVAGKEETPAFLLLSIGIRTEFATPFNTVFQRIADEELKQTEKSPDPPKEIWTRELSSNCSVATDRA